MGLSTITCIDTAAVRANFQVEGVSTKGALTTLATALQAYSDTDLRTRHFHDMVEVVGTPVRNGPESSCEFKAVIQYYDNDNNKYHMFELPGPKASLFEVVAGQGERVTSVGGNAIIALLATATGLDLAFVKGWPQSKKTQEQ